MRAETSPTSADVPAGGHALDLQPDPDAMVVMEEGRGEVPSLPSSLCQVAKLAGAGPGRFDELLVHRRDYHGARIAYRGGTGYQRSVGQPQRREAPLWAAFGRRAYCVTGLLRSVGSPARAVAPAR